MICCHVSGSVAMFAASAIGFGMAMTVGVRARLGWRSGMIRSASLSAEALRTQALESGTQASGRGPLVAVSHSPARAVATSAESLLRIVTVPQTPSTDGEVAAQRSPRSFMIDAMGGATATVASAWPLHPSLIR